MDEKTEGEKMRITSTLNNEKLKFLYSWVDTEGYVQFGTDVLISEIGKIIIIDWLNYNRKIILR